MKKFKIIDKKEIGFLLKIVFEFALDAITALLIFLILLGLFKLIFVVLAYAGFSEDPKMTLFSQITGYVSAFTATILIFGLTIRRLKKTWRLIKK